jgi:hypothetical protein
MSLEKTHFLSIPPHGTSTVSTFSGICEFVLVSPHCGGQVSFYSSSFAARVGVYFVFSPGASSRLRRGSMRRSAASTLGIPDQAATVEATIRAASQLLVEISYRSLGSSRC